jgi:hypothetical protein
VVNEEEHKRSFISVTTNINLFFELYEHTWFTPKGIKSKFDWKSGSKDETGQRLKMWFKKGLKKNPFHWNAWINYLFLLKNQSAEGTPPRSATN